MESAHVEKSATAAPKESHRHRRRRATACERCNQKRIRCDASALGQPCSNCRKVKNQECRLIRSRRTRGSTGQFVSPLDHEMIAQSPRLEQDSNVSASTTLPTLPKDAPTRTTQEPEFSLNFERLHDDNASPIVSEAPGRERDPVSTRNVPSSSTDPCRNQNPRQSRPAFIGESWFASFLSHNATARDTDIHQPVEVVGSNETNLARSPPPQSGTQSATSATDNITTKPQDLPPQHLRKRLIESYFSLFHAYCPILNKSSFISSVEDCSVSPTLLRCVLFVATTQCDPSIFHLLGYNTRMDFGDDFFTRAKASFESDNTSDRMAMLQSSYLLHCWWGQPTAFKDSLWWLSSAIRSAQCMGMNRSTKRSRMSQPVQAQWKRIWWCLYIRDRQISFAVGVPMIINEIDCDVEDLTLGDFPDETLETAYYIMGQAELNRAASNLFFRHCALTRLQLSSDSDARHYAQQNIRTTLCRCRDDLPKFPQRERRHYLSLTIDMCYNFYLIHHQQRVRGPTYKSDIHQEDLKFILDAADNITRLLEDAMIYWSPEYLPMMWVTAIFAAMNVQYFALRSGPPDRELVLAKLRSSLIVLKQFEQYYVVARWIRILWTNILDRAGHGSRRLASSTRISRDGSQQNIATSDVDFQPATNQDNTVPFPSTHSHHDQAAMMAESQFIADERLQMSSYLIDDWSGIVMLDGYDTHVDLQFLSPWNIGL